MQSPITTNCDSFHCPDDQSEFQPVLHVTSYHKPLKENYGVVLFPHSSESPGSTYTASSQGSKLLPSICWEHQSWTISRQFFLDMPSCLGDNWLCLCRGRVSCGRPLPSPILGSALQEWGIPAQSGDSHHSLQEEDRVESWSRMCFRSFRNWSCCTFYHLYVPFVMVGACSDRGWPTAI